MDQKTARSLVTLCNLTLLFVLLLAWAPAGGHASPAAAGSAPSVAAPAAPAAPFLAGLAADGAQPAGLAPSFLTGCTSDAQCPPGKLCCPACGFPGCTAKACLTPMNGHCPLIP